MKLKCYGINGNTLNWIGKWLTSQTQTVIVDGEESTPVPVTSGVPQGTVFGSLMFLICINDIGNNLSEGTHIKLFARWPYQLQHFGLMILPSSQ
jgi:hypothetical protein